MQVPRGLLLWSDPPSATSEMTPVASPAPLDRSTFFVVAGLLAGLFVALRAWALVPSWFYADDHRLLGQAQDARFGVGYLSEPFDSQLMPLGRAVAWLVTHDRGGDVVQPSWGLAVTVSLVLSAAAAASCLWMLTVAFGPRWEVLVLYALALTSTVALPAGMWWAASLNQLPLLIAWPGAVAATLSYLRTRRPVWIVALLGMLTFGLLGYVKVVLVVPVLAYLVLAYFADGSLPSRVRTTVRDHPVPVLAVALLTAGFTAYYVVAVPSVVTQSSVLGTAGPLADRLIGTSWASAVVGGPWRWDAANAPVSVTDPPDWAVHAAWMLLTLLVAHVALRRTGTLRAWGLVVVGLAMDYVLLLVTRGPVFGAIAGNEMRYLTESYLVVVLGLGLALLPLRSAVRPSRERAVPLLRVGLAPAAAVTLAAVVVAGSLFSTAAYVRTWHDDNPGRTYVDTVAQAVRDRGRLELVDTVVPPEVMSPVLAPYNTASRLLTLHVPELTFPTTSHELEVLSAGGQVSPARIDPATATVAGTVDDCGWRVTSRGRTLPLLQPTIDYDWWLRVGYLSSQRSPLTVTAGDVTREAVVNPGLGSLFVHVDGEFDSVRLSGLDTDTTLCVDVIDVGIPIPSEGP